MITNQAKVTPNENGKFIVTLLNGDKQTYEALNEYLLNICYAIQTFAIINDFEAFEDCWVTNTGDVVAQINERDELLANILRAFAIGHLNGK